MRRKKVVRIGKRALSQSAIEALGKRQTREQLEIVLLRGRIQGEAFVAHPRLARDNDWDADGGELDSHFCCIDENRIRVIPQAYTMRRRCQAK